jgi:hypothetical protein
MTTFLKSAILFVAIFAVLIFCARSKESPGRYQIVNVGDQVELFDMKTFEIYYKDNGVWHKIDNNEADVAVKELPK